jgi:hypothetical protein
MRGRRITAGLVLAGVALAGCGSAQSSSPSTHRDLVSPFYPSCSAASCGSGQVVVGVTLHRTTVRAGVPIRGSLVLTNDTGKWISVEGCQVDGNLVVGIGNKKIPFAPTNGGVACVSRIGPGSHRFPQEVLTTYEACGGGGLPKCGHGVNTMPPLPAGHYFTSVELLRGLPAGTRAPRSIAVTLLR